MHTSLLLISLAAGLAITAAFLVWRTSGVRTSGSQIVYNEAARVHPLIPNTSTKWKLWHHDLFDRETSPSLEAEGTNILTGLYELWKHTLNEGVTYTGTQTFSSFDLTWGETVETTAGAGVQPFDNSALVKLKLWAILIGKHALSWRLAKLHLRFLQRSSRWTARSLNPDDEARELLRYIDRALVTKTSVASVASLLAGALFLFAALGPTLFGNRALNTAYLVIGAFWVVLGVALRRKCGRPPGSAGA